MTTASRPPHRADLARSRITKETPLLVGDYWADRSNYGHGVNFRELQDVIDATYGDRDRERGVAPTIAWLCEELGELAQAVRKILRQKHNFPRKGKFGITAVYSTEPLQNPEVLKYDKQGEFQCVCPNGENDFHSCESRSVIWGTAGFVTGSFGLTCASVAIREILENKIMMKEALVSK